MYLSVFTKNKSIAANIYWPKYLSLLTKSEYFNIHFIYLEIILIKIILSSFPLKIQPNIALNITIRRFIQIFGVQLSLRE